MPALPLYNRWYADRDFASLRDQRRAACALPVALGQSLDYADYRSSRHLRAYGDLCSILTSPLGLQTRRPH